MRQLIDKITLNLKVLHSLGLPTDQWDVLIVYLVVNKLDYITARDWEDNITTDIPVLGDLIEFLKHKCELLESLQFDKGSKVTSNQGSKPTYQRYVNNAALSVQKPSQVKCFYCNQSHFIYTCEKFKELNAENAFQEARRLNLCTNCLREGHSNMNCRSSGCKHCHKKHNTLFHGKKPIMEPSTSANPQESNITSCNHVQKEFNSKVYTLLSTACLEILDATGQFHTCRALLDAGSQSNFIANDLVNKLQLPSNHIDWKIIGINQNVSSVNKMVNVTIKSKFNNFKSNIDCLGLPKITEQLPSFDLDRSLFNIPSGIKLADNNFNKASPIDVLLGAEIFWTLLCVGQIKINNQPTLQKTHLGWIFGGNALLTNPSNDRTNRTVNQLNLDMLNDNIKRFWELEEVKDSQYTYSPEELECENHFLSTYSRNTHGRFRVRLPFKTNPSKLGSSIRNAEIRFYKLENRFKKQHDLKFTYTAFIDEYTKLGHMSLVPGGSTINKIDSFYLPHHAVVNENKVSTKLRVVFDGSAKSSTGESLNSLLHIGPSLQQELVLILLRFRTYQYVISPDIQKMYRQIEVHPDDRQYQRILWRSNDTDPLYTYELNTVTYGTASAPYLAIRCLKQLGLEASSMLLAQQAILHDFYVDDLLTGADTIDQAVQLRIEIDQILKAGCFHLAKWASNDKRVLSNIETSTCSDIQLDRQQETKTLGLLWNCGKDILKYSNHCHIANKRITKRTILSVISKIYDPLGLIGPIIVTAKILLQTLWQLQIGWDESVPSHIFTSWQQFCKKLPIISTYSIPRRVIESPSSRFELHGFCDASQRAYGACIYIKSISNNPLFTYSHLLCPKSRIAPLKTITVPRLELCAALLLARLVNKIIHAINIEFSQIKLYTDSTIVVAWINTPQARLKTFVANRVSKILGSTDTEMWNHVSTKDNPADIISRGTLPSELAKFHLWWHGPEFLSMQNVETPKQPDILNIENIPDLKSPKATCYLINTVAPLDIFEKTSSFRHLCHVIAYCNRFINNAKNKLSKQVGSLTGSEKRKSQIYIIRAMQSNAFPSEIRRLKKGRNIASNSPLASLSPFIDENDLLRVGGRLRNSNLPFESKHQIVLPKHNLTRALIREEHIRLLHAGQLTTLHSLRRKYWPIAGKDQVKNVLRQCLKCYKVNPVASDQLMGNLPIDRVTSARPFIHCGVDYAGPLSLKEGKRRGTRLVKGYISLFICMATKAIHLELVGDLTTESFLGAVKRFMSRRGHVTDFYSDTGTNFVGAERELKKLLNSESLKNSLILNLTAQNINWHFIPPRAPHQGGLWEASIKLVKQNLKRIVGNANLTFEEMYTVLAGVEACINSRPITPLSNDPNDLRALSPSHFLIGDLLVAPIEADIKMLKMNTLSRWQLVEQIKQHYWKRWTREYLNHLQQRTKWKMAKHDLSVGDMVMVKEENLPPLQWSCGRVTELHSGSDKMVRVVSVKTKGGVVKRAINKICVLPLDNTKDDK